MNLRTISVAVVLAGMVAGGRPASALAQDAAPISRTSPEPDYGSGLVFGMDAVGPASDGRPGVKFFSDASRALRRGDRTHALYMLKLSAYWAYAPAAYDLGVFYFQGAHGFEVNRPLGTAWMFIAAQDGNRSYEAARHMMVADLDSAERSQALRYLEELQPKYGEKVAMHRAKGQWRIAKSQQTGSRVGGISGDLHVGTGWGGEGGSHAMAGDGTGTVYNGFSAADVLGGGSVDGATAYQQFRDSDNPYSPIFVRNRTGTATVGPLQQVDSSDKVPATSSKSGSDTQQPADPGQPD